MPHELWTIGHSVHPFAEFAEWLEAFSIKLVADVRSFPGSRHEPQFNKEVLPDELRARGIGYAHILALGGRRKVLKDSVNTVWRHPAFRGYADYMLNDPAFEDGLSQLKKLAGRERTCVMCSEVLWWRCHRSMIADRMKVDGWVVHHITGLGKEEDHPWTGAARMKAGKLFYGPSEMDLPFLRGSK
jgi:uncharacterized protein (DUF488 family)